MRNEDIKVLFDKQAQRCEEHGQGIRSISKRIDDIVNEVMSNKQEIACIKTERRTLVWLAGIFGAVLSFIVDLIIRRNQ